MLNLPYSVDQGRFPLHREWRGSMGTGRGHERIRVVKLKSLPDVYLGRAQ